MTPTRDSQLTPAGASLIIRRRGRWSTVSVDRWRIADATVVEQWWADGVALAAAYACFDRGRATPVETMVGPIDWQAMCPREDEIALVQGFIGVERHDFVLTASYVSQRAWVDAPAYRVWIASAEALDIATVGLPVPAPMTPARQTRSTQRRVDRTAEISTRRAPVPSPEAMRMSSDASLW